MSFFLDFSYVSSKRRQHWRLYCTVLISRIPILKAFTGSVKRNPLQPRNAQGTTTTLPPANHVKQCMDHTSPASSTAQSSQTSISPPSSKWPPASPATPAASPSQRKVLVEVHVGVVDVNVVVDAGGVGRYDLVRKGEGGCVTRWSSLSRSRHQGTDAQSTPNSKNALH